MIGFKEVIWRTRHDSNVRPADSKHLGGTSSTFCHYCIWPQIPMDKALRKLSQQFDIASLYKGN